VLPGYDNAAVSSGASVRRVDGVCGVVGQFKSVLLPLPLLLLLMRGAR
jgi:hypothetical protein